MTGFRFSLLTTVMSEQKFIIGADMICPVTKKHCDDECCVPGSICNCQSNHIVSGDLPKDQKPFDLKKAVSGAKVMTKSRNYAGHYLLTLEGCPHVYKHVFKMNGPEGERLIQVDDEGRTFSYYSDEGRMVHGGPDDLIMAPEVKTVWINFYLDFNGNVQCTSPQTSPEAASAIANRQDGGVWRFIKTEKIVLEY